MAVFIDYENMVLCAREERIDFSLDPIMEVLRAMGRPVLVRAYGDWGAYPQYPRDLRTHAVVLVQLYRYGMQHKNRADIALAVDAMDTLYRLPHVEVFVIVAGDGDYAPLASKLREMGRRVVGVGIRGSTSPLLVASCDEFLYYDSLVARAGPAMEPLDVLDLVEKALRALSQLGETAVSADRLRQVMVGLDPSFVASPFVQQKGAFESFLAFHPERVQVYVQNGHHAFGLPSGAVEPAQLPEASAAAPPGNGPGNGPEAAPARPSRGPLHVRYRQTLQKEGWTLLNPDDRRKVLRELYDGLNGGPAERDMADVVQSVAGRYEFLGMSIDRQGVEEAARLAWRSGLLETTAEPWHVGAPARLRSEVSQDRFVAACEGVYLQVLGQVHGELDLDAAAQVLLGDARRREELASWRVETDGAHALDSLPQPPLRTLVGERANELVGAAIEQAPPPEMVVSAREARVLFEKGQEQRSRDFVAGARTLLLASRVQWHALRQGDFGASIPDLRWYVASALSAEAGARYISREYEAAVPYYLAYFSMLRRSDRLWEDVSRLTIPMLSYYTILATRLESEPDLASPNAAQPGYLAALVATHENDRVIWRWQQLASSLAQASPAVFDELLQRIETSSADHETIHRTVEWLRDLAQRV